MADLTIPKGDYGYAITFTIQDSTGTVVDLTAYTGATFKAWRQGSPTAIVSTACASLTSSGTCTYTIAAATDFPAIGVYNAEIELAAAGVVASTEMFTVEVTESG
jgi:hypothetical protein